MNVVAAKPKTAAANAFRFAPTPEAARAALMRFAHERLGAPGAARVSGIALDGDRYLAVTVTAGAIAVVYRETPLGIRETTVEQTRAAVAALKAMPAALKAMPATRPRPGASTTTSPPSPSRLGRVLDRRDPKPQGGRPEGGSAPRAPLPARLFPDSRGRMDAQILRGPQPSDASDACARWLARSWPKAFGHDIVLVAPEELINVVAYARRIGFEPWAVTEIERLLQRRQSRRAYKAAASAPGAVWRDLGGKTLRVVAPEEKERLSA